MATRKCDLSLKNFYIFNSLISHKEGEENKKVLFYYPATDDEIKIRDIGLTEAIIKFTGTFNAESKALHTQKTTQLFFQPENDFWMVLTLNVPYEVRTKEGAEITDHRGKDVTDKVFRAVLRQSYLMFKLFAGTFAMNFVGETEDEKADTLRKKLDLFYSKYLLTLKLPSCDIIDVVRSIQYLPVKKNLFLRIHNFINMMQATFPTIEHCVFLYNDQLIWSGINSSDLYSVHEYLVGSLFPKAFESEIQGGPIRRSYSIDCGHYGTFLTGPENFDDSIKAPKIYITQNEELKCFYLIVYRALNGTLCILIDGKSLINDEFYLELHSYMGPQLSSIASEIGETFSKGSNSISNKDLNEEDAGPKYLFINELNLRHKGSFNFNQKNRGMTTIPRNVMSLIADLYNENEFESNGKFEEICFKSISDYWIVKKTSNWRQFYVIIHNNKATLLDITNEAKKLFEQHTSDFFF
ncbi:vacuolar fusion protein CCZ1 homolog [Condylostylus longicornis]|uniref:vacuolar fusion protein CCZ1 homolog n=1 Tax=Condylostylus longicornis TaxID=2530218 RepID=UPI00244E3631|nr:vacuolar fusion protein CCZ1 homolog [Condylostylus longicornis]